MWTGEHPARADLGADRASPSTEGVLEPRFGGSSPEPLEVLGGVACKVEIEIGDPLLDKSPHRLTEVRHEPHQHVDLGVAATVGAEQRLVTGSIEPVVDREVRQVERGVAHAGVLPVDDPEPIAVADEVRREQVVVAGPELDGAAPPLDPVGGRLRELVAGREPDSALPGDRGVCLDDAERVEAARDRRPLVQPPEERRRVCRRHPADLPLDEAGDEVALRLDESDHLGPDAECSSGPRGLVLDAAVDAEEVGVLASDPDDERVRAVLHLEVAVRDAAAERLDRVDAAGPDAPEDVVDHDRIRSPRGSKSGSSAISPATHSPKISTSTGCPAPRPAGRYA